VNLTLFILNDILKNEMCHPVCDELWFILYYLYVGKTGCYNWYQSRSVRSAK